MAKIKLKKKRLPHVRIPTAKLSARAAKIRAQAKANMAQANAERDEEAAYFKNCQQTVRAKCTKKGYPCEKHVAQVCNDRLYHWLRARDIIPSR